MSILEEIVDYKKQIVAKNKLKLNQSELENLVKKENYLCKELNFDKNYKKKLGLIAEIKRKSPSKGIIRKDFSPSKLALEFQKNGASILSILTDEDYFGGSLEIFEEVRKIINLPLLRKDFIIDIYQVWETKYIKADIILLLANILNQNLKHFLDISLNLGLNCLIEVHTNKELELVLEIIKKIPKPSLSKILIGINNRNLNTFEVDINNCLNLKKLIPKKILTVAESGITTTSDLEKLEEACFNAVLVGEGLVKNKELLEWFLG
jgi:indole-3-glycerol phosphate synthase